jgi:hypothetical protein
MEQTPNYINLSTLRELLGSIGWSKLERLFEIGVIENCHATCGSRPLWRMDSVERIRRAVADYESGVAAARNNATAAEANALT